MRVWWAEPDNLVIGTAFTTLALDVNITSDFSNEGWGAPCKDCTIAGHRKNIHRGIHISWLEIEAGSLTLYHNFKWLRDKTLLYIASNVYINKGGGTNSSKINHLTRKLIMQSLQVGVFYLAGDGTE